MQALPRFTHPVAWWVWAIGLLVAASRTTNLLLLALLLGVQAVVVAQRRPSAPWARAFEVSLRLGAFVIVTRLALQLLISAPIGTHVAFTLPSLALPAWMAGVRLGGLVTWETLLIGLTEGVRLAVMITAVGAANSLAAPSRLLRSVPGALYEIGVAVVVALSVTPNLLADAGRVAGARRLRGHEDGRLKSFAHAAGPVLEGGLDRSIALAAAMDSRGYGRLGTSSARSRRAHAGLVLAGCAGALIGMYGLMDASAPAILGWPMLGLGAVVAIVGLRVGGGKTARSRYRPDPWSVGETVTATTGILVAAVFVISSSYLRFGLAPSIVPIEWPNASLLVIAAVLLAVLPGFLTPQTPDTGSTS